MTNVSQVNQCTLLHALNKAIDACNKSGLGLSYFAISNIKQKAG